KKCYKVGESGKMIFLGTYFHNIDAKNRLSMPAKFASSLGNEIVISKGFDGCLEIRSSNSFETYANKLMNLTQTKKDSRIVIRQLLANAANVELDKARRILIPANLLKEANIGSSVVVIGIGNKIEI
ncbi:MAG: division/cell wall cluster transcriptional repressor MraZ, partial [Mycoplasmoidaceae bacterium]|nr:division/cell wall cluster transcriptional repressor MraZ [Mycoplasmoidaceae bacterium]